MFTKKYLFLLLGMILLIGSVSASLGNFEVCQQVDIKTIQNATWVNISTINYPNGSIAKSNIAMSQIGTNTWVYKFNDTCTLGTYNYDYAVSDGTLWENDFTIGPTPTSGVIVVFILFFVLILALVTYSLVEMVTHVFKVDYDAIDFAKAVGIYFALLALNLMQRNFLGNVDIQNWFVLFIKVGLWTQVIIPAFSLGFSMIVGNYLKLQRIKKMEQGI